MSRWLWALLGSVVLVAIAAVFWTDRNQTNVTPPVSPGPVLATAPPTAPAPATVARQPAPSPPPAPAQEAASPPAPSPPTTPPAPTAAPDAGQQAATPPAPTPSRETPSAPPTAEAPLPPPAPGREAEVQGVYAPKSLAQLVGTWAYNAEDCERLFQRRGGGWAYRQPVDKFAQAAIVEFDKEDPSAFRHLPDRGRV